MSITQESQIPLNHLQQMITFARGTGVEFLPVIDDTTGTRGAFLTTLIAGNRLDLVIPQMLAWMIREGRILLELYPNGYSHRTPYRIKAYKPGDYRLEYDAYGDISAAKYCYSYRSVEPGGKPRIKWVALRVTSLLIEFSDLDQRPDLDQEIAAQSTAPNPLGFLPYVEVLNPPPAGGELGESDFEIVRSQLEVHDEVTSGIVEKILEFSFNPLVTNKPAQSVYEGMYESGGEVSAIERNSVAYASGFKISDAVRRKRHKRLRKVFGDFELEDRLEQLNINPIPQDHVLFADQYERQLREALGGILERGIETATESRVVYGKVAATAKDKQTALFKYGLCEILSLAILAEEAVYAASKGKQGIPPLGDRSVNYRVGAVFMPTTQDTLNRSIVGRNLTEIGVNAKETLKWCFPDKTETEIDQMVGSGGLPIRYLNQVMAMFTQANTSLFNPMTQLPYVDPQTGATIAESFIPFILNALRYGLEFNSYPNQSGSDSSRFESAALNAANARIRQQRGNAEPTVRPVANGDRTGAATNAAPIPDPLPQPGTTVKQSPLPGFFDLSKSPILQWTGIANRE